MSTQSDEQKAQYVVMELSAPVVITLTNAEAFEASVYRIGSTFITASGQWKGEKGQEVTVMLPLTSVLCVNFLARRVPEDEVPQYAANSVKLQVEQIKNAAG